MPLSASKCNEGDPIGCFSPCTFPFRETVLSYSQRGLQSGMWLPLKGSPVDTVFAILFHAVVKFYDLSLLPDILLSCFPRRSFFPEISTKDFGAIHWAFTHSLIRLAAANPADRIAYHSRRGLSLSEYCSLTTHPLPLLSTASNLSPRK